MKSIQIFRKPVERAVQGDRCGICLANVDSKQFERGIICAPEYVKTAYAVLISFNKIKHFKNHIESGSKFHITIGHETLIGKVELFGSLSAPSADNKSDSNFDFNRDYLHLDGSEEDENKENVEKKETRPVIQQHFALIDFTNENETQSVLCTQNSLVIGSKLDTDIHLNQCRIGFYGKVLHLFTNKDFKDPSSAAAAASASASTNHHHLSDLRVYKEKQKEGVVERKHDEYTLIGRSLFKKETNISIFAGLKVQLSTGDKGVIEGAFGQSGKFKIRLSDALSKTAKDILDSKSSAKSAKKSATSQQQQQDPNLDSSASAPTSAVNDQTTTGQIRIYLKFKRYIYDDKKKMIQ